MAEISPKEKGKPFKWQEARTHRLCLFPHGEAHAYFQTIDLSTKCLLFGQLLSFCLPFVWIVNILTTKFTTEKKFVDFLRAFIKTNQLFWCFNMITLEKCLKMFNVKCNCEVVLYWYFYILLALYSLLCYLTSNQITNQSSATGKKGILKSTDMAYKGNSFNPC